MRPEDLLLPTPSGVCCKTGGFHIDPTRAVERALGVPVAAWRALEEHQHLTVDFPIRPRKPRKSR